MGRRKTPVDWEEVVKWLEMGYQVTEMAELVGISRVHFSHRATAELTEDQRVRWKKAINRETKCGTRAGYCRHRRKGEEPCGPCFKAQSEYAHNYWVNTGRFRRAAGKEAAAEEGPGSAGN